jgi:hypothetical protein
MKKKVMNPLLLTMKKSYLKVQIQEKEIGHTTVL